MEQSSSKPKFKIGDMVRISKYKRKVFDKGYTPNWSEEVFTGRGNLPNAERQMPNAERRTQNAKRRTPNAERRTPNAERRTPNAERRTPNAERRTPNDCLSAVYLVKHVQSGTRLDLSTTMAAE